MTVGVLLITHGNLGQELLTTAESMLGICPLQTKVLAVSGNVDLESMQKKAIDACNKLDTGEGVLVLTDIYGSTPSNIANHLIDQPSVAVIAGVNQPMLIRVMNYPALNLQEMMIKAISGGHDGIVLCNEMQK